MDGRLQKGSGGGLVSRPVVLIILITLAAVVGFQLLISVVPLYVDENGGGSLGAGLSTAAFMLTTVLAQAQMPWLIARFGYRRMLAVGLVLLGPPALLYSLTTQVAPLVVVTAPRGAGFGIVTVVFTALMYELAPEGRRGEALAVLGMAMALPTIFCNPLGLWLAEGPGYGVVFLLGGLLPLLGIAAIPALAVPARIERTTEQGGFLHGIRRGPLLRPALMFAVSTLAAGVVLTFLPLGIGARGIFSAASALLVMGVATTLGRWVAGRFTDRVSARPLFAPGILCCALGVAVVPFGGVVLLVGATLFGLGFGVLQNAALVEIMARVPKEERGLGSAVWNFAYDGGTGIGALVFGVVIPATGFDAAFYLCGLLVAAALPLLLFDRR